VIIGGSGGNPSSAEFQPGFTIVRLLRLKIYVPTVEEASLDGLKSSDLPAAELSAGMIDQAGQGANDSAFDDERTLPDFVIESAARLVAPFTTSSLEQGTLLRGVSLVPSLTTESS
jgi:hypothetical protein